MGSTCGEQLSTMLACCFVETQPPKGCNTTVYLDFCCQPLLIIPLIYLKILSSILYSSTLVQSMHIGLQVFFRSITMTSASIICVEPLPSAVWNHYPTITQCFICNMESVFPFVISRNIDNSHLVEIENLYIQMKKSVHISTVCCYYIRIKSLNQHAHFIFLWILFIFISVTYQH